MILFIKTWGKSNFKIRLFWEQNHFNITLKIEFGRQIYWNWTKYTWSYSSTYFRYQAVYLYKHITKVNVFIEFLSVEICEKIWFLIIILKGNRKLKEKMSDRQSLYHLIRNQNVHCASLHTSVWTRKSNKC